MLTGRYLLARPTVLLSDGAMEGVYPGPLPGTGACVVRAKLGGLFQGAMPGVNELIVLWPGLGDPTSGIGIDTGL
jgi:hypothetical protein